MSSYVENVVMVQLSCGFCHLPFGVTGAFDAAGRRRGSAVWCPAGHEMHYGENTEEKLGRQLRNAQAQAIHERDQREAVQRSLSATKGVLTRTRNRIHAGVCPHCNRTFSNVARHMASKHLGA